MKIASGIKASAELKIVLFQSKHKEKLFHVVWIMGLIASLDTLKYYSSAYEINYNSFW